MFFVNTFLVDIWSIGCVFAELLCQRILFEGANTRDQLERIITIIGTPAAQDVRGCEAGVHFIAKLPKKLRIPFQKLFPYTSPDAIDLLTRMLEFNPEKRITIDDALAHPFISEVTSEVAAQYYHYPNNCPTAFTFDMDSTKLSLEQVKQMLYQEVMQFQPDDNACLQWINLSQTDAMDE